MAKKDKISLLKALVDNAQKSTDSITIALGKAAAKELKQKGKISSALTPIKTKDGFEAYLNINTTQLKHGVISQKILDGIPFKEAIKQKDHHYLRDSPELILKMPLEATEERKRQFLQKTTNFYKGLIKARLLKDGKIEEITHISKKGKHLNLLKDYKGRNIWIRKRINELRKSNNAPKLNIIFKQVGKEIVNQHHFGNLSINKPLSSSTVRNIYYSK